ncbi:hypothetical protein [Micromonospora carbonacea]|uniref:DUF4345 domain-containing protein n=1 Tax=Micromonospora carbonacea TaxID=47853 RepID=A0A7H8XV68_9ACTN|nr:hypothetical protein [Micromonospora carbonacea]MBB5823872.1 hypothetical protein [Micromonospora carbonacea]QLD27852.1 hypothetical protein HXZ27_29565 [Micromonospora carbonacea]
MRLPRSSAGWTIAVFGVLALLMGALGLLWPEAQLRMLGFEVPQSRSAGDYTGTFLTASAMASFNMGVYYLLATATEWRAFYRFTVVFRLVTFAVFTIVVLADVAPDRFFGVALWEGLGAVATAVALRRDARRAAPAPGAAQPARQASAVAESGRPAPASAGGGSRSAGADR